MGEHFKRWTEETYAQLRLDGKTTHEQAMAEIQRATKAAIPQAVSQFMADLRKGDEGKTDG
jgi:hypothetical protein